MGDWALRLIEQSGYLGIAFLMFVETVFPPIPSEIIMSLAGVQSGKGQMSLPLVIAAGTAGAMLGNLVWYLLARALGLDRFRPLVARWGRWLTLDWTEVERGEALFRRYDWLFVCIGRMIPTIRSLVSIPAGLADMSLSRFLVWSTIGTAGWTAALAIAGYLLGSRYEAVDDYLGPVSNIVLLVLAGWYLIRVLVWKPSRRD